MTSRAQAPARTGRHTRRREGRPVEVAVVLAVVSLINVLLWPLIAEGVNPVFGFRVGQTRDLPARMEKVSRNPLIRDTWTLYLRIGALVGEETLRRPAVQPLDPDLLAYVAGVDSVVTDAVEVSPRAVSSWPRENAQAAVDRWGVRYLLFEGPTGDAGYQLVRDPTGADADWLLAPRPWVAGGA